MALAMRLKASPCTESYFLNIHESAELTLGAMGAAEFDVTFVYRAGFDVG